MMKAPEDIAGAFQKAWMARDGHAIAALFVEDADFVNVVGIWWEDRDAIAKAHDYALKSFFAETRLVVGRVKTRLLGESAAIVQARMTLTGQLAPDGREAARRVTILTFVMERTSSGWVCVAAQNTDIVPGAESHFSSKNGISPVDYRETHRP